MNIFVQISSSAVVLPQTTHVEKVLFGLDASGAVWNYNFIEERWEALPDKENSKERR